MTQTAICELALSTVLASALLGCATAAVPQSFVLRGADGGGSGVPIDFTYSGPTTLGWAALLRAPSRRHAFGRP